MYANMWSLFFLALFANAAQSVDPSDPVTNLDYFVRSGSRKDSKSSVTYFNGTVYAKQPGKDLQRLFNFEGFNINRMLPQVNGSYLSLSRELMVYRNLITGQIIQVWINPWTDTANEVFNVANDPVNELLELGSIIPFQIQSNRIAFNRDYILEYPNPLASSNYSKYSAGPVYDATELYALFANLSALADPQTPTVPSVGTWFRKSQFLPWMEMSTTPGFLYYSTLNWKCNELSHCVADDILKLVLDKYPNYKNAPTDYESPNESSWSNFKKIIDERRADGKPDIIIPQVPTVSNVTTKETFVDPRVLAILNRPLQNRVAFNGTAWTEIIGKQQLKLIDFVGFVDLDFEHLPNQNGYRIQLDGLMSFVNTSTGEPLTFWKNPVTGKSILLNNPMEVGVEYVVKKDFMYTIDMKAVEILGLIASFSTNETVNDTTWSMNFVNLIIENPDTSSHFYGSAGQFSNWPDWMEMQDTHGNLVAKVTFYKQ